MTIERYSRRMARMPRLDPAEAEKILRECGYEFVPSDRYYGPRGFAKALDDLVAARREEER